MDDFFGFLETKGAEYAPFDPHRAKRILNLLPLSIPSCKIIHIIGTNGKGSTGRFLALMLKAQGLRVGHFTSPHLLEVRERFWDGGELVSNERLEELFSKLSQTKKQQLALFEASYFEVLTFLALGLFCHHDYLILEAGLGGEYDSTTTCTTPYLTLFSSISLDHQDYLGEDLLAIATTKLKAMSQKAILGFQENDLVLRIARSIAKAKCAQLLVLEPKHITKDIQAHCKHYGYPLYQYENLSLAYWAFNELGYDLCWEEFEPLDLAARGQWISPFVCVDVAHNEGGARLLQKQFSKEKFILVYNSYIDKNPKKILAILKPLIQRVEILPLAHERIIPQEQLEDILKELHLCYCEHKGLCEGQKYLVCGSFSVVAEFLKRSQS